MKSKLLKSMVSVIMCVVLLMGYASVSNASVYIPSGGNSTVGSFSGYAGTYNFTYSVSFIRYDGMPSGAHIYSGLTAKCDYNQGNTYESVTMCTINSNSGNGSFYTAYSGGHSIKLYNQTGRNVTISIVFTL